jgi:hypothetical protein
MSGRGSRWLLGPGAGRSAQRHQRLGDVQEAITPVAMAIDGIAHRVSSRVIVGTGEVNDEFGEAVNR